MTGRHHGAQFVEVRVDVDTAEVHVTRMLGVFAAAQDPLLARSRHTGAMIQGLATAAVVNAVTGCRIRDLPIHPATLLAATEPYTSTSI